MTGYEKSPDYGGPEPHRWEALWAAGILGVAILAYVFFAAG